MDVRLIIDAPAPGSTNMATDEALLESASQGEATLRFYRWSPATLSLGYFQPDEDRRKHAASASLDVVRRTTGGGAIVHDHDLTYSFVTPIKQRFSGDHQQLVRAFHEALCESLAKWQIDARPYNLPPAESPPAGQSSQQRFLCFQRRAVDDVVYGDFKVAGSAQRRRRNALLQHGSVLLEKSAFAPELPGILDLVGPRQASRAPVNIDALVQSWSERIAVRLGANLVRAELTGAERLAVENHAKARYESAAWQKRR